LSFSLCILAGQDPLYSVTVRGTKPGPKAGNGVIPRGALAACASRASALGANHGGERPVIGATHPQRRWRAPSGAAVEPHLGRRGRRSRRVSHVQRALTCSVVAAAHLRNGVVEPSEECDDGNAQNGDGCLTTCQQPVNWVPSDLHVHSTGCSRYTSPEDLAQRLRARGLQVGAALVWGEGYDDDALLFTGRDHPASGPGFILHYDMEVSHFAAAKTGHLVLLGLDSLRFSDDVIHTPSSGVPVIEWRAASRAPSSAWPRHYWPDDGSFPVPPGGCCVPWEVVVNAARGRLDFLSMERVAAGQGPVDAGTFRLWKAIQNAGFRVAIAGGKRLGVPHSRLRRGHATDGRDRRRPLTYEGWLRAIKAGRTTAASGAAGDHFNLRVERGRLGDEVPLAASQDVTVTVETSDPHRPTSRCSSTARSLAECQSPLALRWPRFEWPILRSSWIAARSPRVLTSPRLRSGRRAADPGVRQRRSATLWRSNREPRGPGDERAPLLSDSRDEALGAYGEAVTSCSAASWRAGGSPAGDVRKSGPAAGCGTWRSCVGV